MHAFSKSPYKKISVHGPMWILSTQRFKPKELMFSVEISCEFKLSFKWDLELTYWVWSANRNLSLRFWILNRTPLWQQNTKMKVSVAFQKCSAIVNLNLAPAFGCKYDYSVWHDDKLKRLGTTTTKPSVVCSTLILSNISRQRDVNTCCLLTVNNRKRRGEKRKNL